MKAWLAREGLPVTRAQEPQLLAPEVRRRTPSESQRAVTAATQGLSCIMATILSMHRPALAKDSSHEEMRGHHQLEGDGRGNPKWMLLPPIHPTPPNLSKAPFTVCSLK